MTNIHKRMFSSIDESQTASAAADRAEGDAGVARGGSSTVKCVERVVGASTPSVGRLSSFVVASVACLCVTQVRLCRTNLKALEISPKFRWSITHD